MGPDQLIGRAAETQLLQDRLSGARAGRARVVLLVGEPGIGKSRLAAEVADRAEPEGSFVAWARSHEDGGAPPYWLWRQVLQRAGTGLPPAPEDQDRHAFFDEVTRRVVALGERTEAGAVIVLDDLQWADEPSRVLLQYLVGELRGAHLLVIATHRPNVEAGITELLREPLVERVDIGGLSHPETLACMEAVTGSTVDAARAGRVFDATGGNPFYVREIARAGEAASGVPPTVLDAVRTRVARLDPATRAQLTTGALIGEEFSVPVVAGVLGETAATCLQGLQQARQAGIVEPAVTAGNFRFTHALLRLAIEEGVPAAERVTLHRAAAQAIESIYGGDLEPHLAELARHWSAVAVSGERRPALDWCRRAGDQAMRAVAFEQAGALYRQAIEVGGPILEPAERCELWLGVGAAEWKALNVEAARQACAEATVIARREGHTELQAAAALTIEPVGHIATDHQLREWCADALAAVAEDAAALKARLLARLTEASIYAGEHDAALSTSEQALQLADRSGEAVAVVAALRARQLACAGPEHVSERQGLAARMIETGIVLRRPSDEMYGRLWKIDAHFEKGELAGAVEETGRLRACVERVGSPMARWHQLVVGAACAQSTARFTEAFESAHQAFELLINKGHPAAFGAFMSVVSALRHHVGFENVSVPFDTTRPPPELAPRGEVRASIFMYLGPAFELAEAGRLDEARGLMGGAGPPEAWDPPPYFRLSILALAARVSGLTGDTDGLRLIHEQLAAFRGCHVVTGAGTGTYLGPTELWLGRAAVQLGNLEAGLADLTAAVASCESNGAVGFVAEGRAELAAALLQAGQANAAAELAARARAGAEELGMVPWATHAERHPGRRCYSHHCHHHHHSRCRRQRRAVGPRDRGGRPGGGGQDQPPDRRGPLRIGAHGPEPCAAHSGEAGLLEPQPDRRLGSRPGPRHEPT